MCSRNRLITFTQLPWRKKYHHNTTTPQPTKYDIKYLNVGTTYYVNFLDFTRVLVMEIDS